MTNFFSNRQRVKGAAAQNLLKDIWRNRWLYIFVIPGVFYFLIFKYIPMGGVVIAFKDYTPFLGIVESQWVGWKHFERLFQNNDFVMLFRNTILISLYKLLFYFPVPIILALMLNEVRLKVFKRFVQTVIYIPHFFSWVVVAGITYVLLTTEGGIVNEFIMWAGGEKINFLGQNAWIRTLLTSQTIWREAGWGTILYLAAMSAVDPQLYEAAKIDGAGRFRQMWNVTLPCIRSTIVILLILQIGNFMDLGFEQIYNMINAGNKDYGNVFDTYVYTIGIKEGQFSYSTAIGLFKSVIGLILVLGSNYLARRSGEEGIF
ncbi:sugar ABC transporter permease [Paenibacillus sp. PL2-23]|uniref:ABC transporter permease n=1 Tax=Paenibacillus sp. PL2-23 TaxID=2100729 RepID=UPI0030F80F0C